MEHFKCDACGNDTFTIQVTGYKHHGFKAVTPRTPTFTLQCCTCAAEHHADDLLSALDARISASRSLHVKDAQA